MREPFPANLDLSRVARRTGHANRRVAIRAVCRETNRKAGGRLIVPEIAIATQIIRHEGLPIRLLQRQDPPERHDPRSLIAAVELGPGSASPVGTLIDGRLQQRIRLRRGGNRWHGAGELR